MHEDGRGESIWDRFCATPGKIANGDTGEIACDFYHRYPADIELMREAGLNAFRLSIAWPRVLPDGRGAVNEAGLDFYDRLVDALVASGVEPVVTLYHWDLPVALEDAGGWPNRETAYAFAEFAEVVARRLGDRVTQWITLNEPWCSAWLGYGSGEHAPGRTSVPDAVSAAHHLLLAHGLAVQAIRREAPNAKIGISVNPTHIVAASPEDADAAFAADGHQNRWLLDPLFGRGYPADVLERFGAEPTILPGDLETIATPIDVLGVNYYHRHVVVAESDGWAIERQPGSEYTAMGWEVWPDGLVDLLQRLHTDYAPPEMWITENGAAYDDVLAADGRVDDPRRLAYLACHLDAVGRAVEAGHPRQRLLRLVAARQLRMGARILEALRHRLRGLRDARAHTEVELLLVPRLRRD